jgi:hypothetical protein
MLWGSMMPFSGMAGGDGWARKWVMGVTPAQGQVISDFRLQISDVRL